jgi:hypothetical protein
MYSTCIFCNHSLGANRRIEHFPVGGRLAFDAAKGRLWAVCTECHRWNLSPLEERWEAIEECERLFRGTLVRVSTDNIGMARLAEWLGRQSPASRSVRRSRQPSDSAPSRSWPCLASRRSWA